MVRVFGACVRGFVFGLSGALASWAGQAAAQTPSEFLAGEHAGRLIEAERLCAGKVSDAARRALDGRRAKDATGFDAGVVFGEAQVRELLRASGLRNACQTVETAYGPAGLVVRHAWLRTAAVEPDAVDDGGFDASLKLLDMRRTTTAPTDAFVIETGSLRNAPPALQAGPSRVTVVVETAQRPSAADALDWFSPISPTPARQTPRVSRMRAPEASVHPFGREACQLTEACEADLDWCGC